VQQNAAAATAALVSQFPELRGLTPEQLPVAIRTLAASNPQRAESILRHIESTRALIAENQRVQAEQVQAYGRAAQQQWNQVSRAADDQYSAYEATRPAAEVKAVRENVTRVLSSAYGINEATLVDLYWQNPLVRSAAFQKMAYDLTAAQLAREGIAAKRDRSAPAVQRPGSPTERVATRDVEFKHLSDRIDRTSGRDQVRAAAEFVAAKRRSR
jgi:hypothetical protein